MTQAALSSVKKLAKLTDINEYTDAGAAAKVILHSAGKAFLGALANDLGLGKGDVDIRSNKGGIAVSGEVTLHGDKLYVQLEESCVGEQGVGILYRSCQGKKDYNGGRNNFINIKSLNEDSYPGFVATCRVLMDQVQPAPKATVRP